MTGAVLHIDTGREWRGGQRQVLLLAAGMQQRGVKTTIACPATAPLAKQAAARNIPTVDFSCYGDVDPFAPAKLQKIVAAGEYEVVHAHTSHAHGMGLKALKQMRDVLFVVSRRVDFEPDTNIFNRRKYLHRRVYYIAITKAVAGILESIGVKPERISVVYSAIEPREISKRIEQARPRAEVRAGLDLPESAPVIINAGALVEHKGQEVLISAMKDVLDEIPDARCIIAGKGKLKSQLQKAIDAAGLADVVRLIGHREDIIDVMRACDLLAMPSIQEGLGTAMLDAALCALPVVASDVGGIPELIEDGVTGKLAVPGDSTSLAAAIIDALSDREGTRAWARKLHAKVNEQFCAEAMVEGTLAAYRKALGA